MKHTPFLALLVPALLLAQRPDTTRNPQNPSPMTESTRKHERVEEKPSEGFHGTVLMQNSKPASVFVPAGCAHASSFDLLVHFHGAPYVTEFAASRFSSPLVAVTVNLGSGSSKYNDGFIDTTTFPRLLDSVRTLLVAQGYGSRIEKIYLSGWSAGYGAIRRILSSSSNYPLVTGVLLLDGIHASYVPERMVLAEGGNIQPSDLDIFLLLARDASRQESLKRFLITHSEIFPGTFVSTTEATDYLLQQLGLSRTPVLEWGPVGMQQLSRSGEGHFEVLGFAGNSAQDHVDHLHSLFRFLQLLSRL